MDRFKRALESVHSVCPECFSEIARPAEINQALLKIVNPQLDVSVSCACGWTGSVPFFRWIRE